VSDPLVVAFGGLAATLVCVAAALVVRLHLLPTGLDPVRHGVSGYASGPATWTQDFALPLGQSAPSRNWAPAHGCPY